jgi:peptide/nickel transport system permease protein
MDFDKQSAEDQLTPADLLTGADQVESLPGLTAPVPDTVEKFADRPVEEMSPTPIGQFVPVPVVMPAQSQRLVFLRTLLRSPTARVGAAIVLFFVVVAIFAPVIAPGDPAEFVGAPNQPPSAAHIFGTDSQGRDVYRLTVWGGRSSLAMGFGAGLLTTFIATLIGTAAGYFRGWVDDLLTLLMNLFLVLPGLPLLIFLAAYLQPGTLTVILALAMTGWAFGARIIRAQALSVREREFVNAAIVSGEPDSAIIFSEILPNLINIIVGGLVGSVTYGIGAATSLSFLGLTSTTDVNWGTNLFWAQNGGALSIGAWWTFVPSGLCVALVAFGLSLINYGMDEITNPRLRAERELRHGIKNIPGGRVRATPVVFSDDW